MEAQGVIKKVDHHTDWCSSLTTTLKPDGSLRVCLDPKRLNDAIKRCPHKIPTLEELTPSFADAKFFSKLDAKAGYWSVHIDEDYQDLTTFRTIFGRYCFRRLPFGLKISQDIFQQYMDRILERAPGCVGIADDIAVYGKTEDEHDQRLFNLMKVAAEEGLVFNSKKCIIKTDRIAFFGEIYSNAGVFPDPAKVEDLQMMPTPQDKEDLHRFIGMITYLASYIPKFAELVQPLRDLLKSDVPFIWQDDHQATFEALKRYVTSTSCLQYFDPNKHTFVEVDASQKRLGACLVQDGKPVAFAPKALKPHESNYSNIERETLAMVFGVLRFHTYLFGKNFTLLSDQKPLEMIWRKPLKNTPLILQRLLVKLQGYDFDVQYKPGSDMVLADALSRLPNPHNAEEIALDIGVGEIIIDDIEETVNIDLVNFGSNKQEALKIETGKDPTLRALWQIVINGWPDDIRELPTALRPYWSFRDEIGVSTGVMFKGRQVIVPENMRPDILEQLHHGHMGIERSRRLARESVYWPGINEDINKLIKSCDTCQEMQPSQQKEPLQPHDIPPHSWTKLATNLFTLDGEDYLVITDYYSKYPILSKLRNTKSETVVQAISTTFSLFGPPNTIVSDNGPQYTGQPFKNMCLKWGINHTTSSPRYPRSNGLAERTVRTVKTLVQKCKKTKQDVQVAMLNLRATPIDGKLPSPAEMLLGRQIRTQLPSYQHVVPSENHDALRDKSEKMKTKHDKTAGQELPPLYVGQKVRVQQPENKSWEPAKVTEVCTENRSYVIQTPNGSSLRRNRSHIREMPSNIARNNGQKPITDTPKRVRIAKPAIQPKSTTPKKPPVEQPTDHKMVKKRRPPEEGNQKTTRSGRISRRPARYDE